MKREKSRLHSRSADAHEFHKNTLPVLLLLPVLIVGVFGMSLHSAEELKPAANASDFRFDQNENYPAIDLYALMTPFYAEKSIPALASYLFKAAKDDKQKVRAIFRWITSRISYDTKAYFSGRPGDNSPGSVLKSRSSVCMGYAGLFKALCDQAQIQCVIINGYAKGYSYRIGDRIGGATNHSWNAVNINGKWRLLDSTWGAGHLEPGGKFVKEYEEFYFFTPPHFFITNHLPEDPQWQLLDKPISAKQYETLVELNPRFFKLGFSFDDLSHKNAIMETNESLVVRLKHIPSITLIAEILNQGSREVPDTTLVSVSGGEFLVSAVFKYAGEYTLRIYGKQKTDPNRYKDIITYKIDAKVARPDKRACFPKTFKSYSMNNVYLYRPLQGYLKIGRDYFFSIKLPGAQQAAVVIGENWHYLEQEEEGIFEGRVTVQGKKIEVYAQYPGQENYSAILRYTGY